MNPRLANQSAADAQGGNVPTARAVARFVVLLGAVSLFADATYEGARSVLGPLLSGLDSGLALAGSLAGLGEAAAYALRLGSGVLADRWRAYWSFTAAGYVVNLAAVPLLALAGTWQLAAVLVLAERAGKGLRGPARDALLASVTARYGHGRAFGVHELMDQIGAVAGPLWLALLLGLGLTVRVGLASLAVPALLSLTSLAVAHRWWQRALEPPEPRAGSASAARGDNAIEPPAQPRKYWQLILLALLTNIAFANWLFLGYLFERHAALPARHIALLYALAMGVDAALAIPIGRAYDRWRLGVLPLGVLSAGVATVSGLWARGIFLGVLSAVLWGCAMCFQETAYKAAVAGLVGSRWRATAYGWLHAAQGMGWLVGGALLGVAYESFGREAATIAAVLPCAAALFVAADLARAAMPPPSAGGNTNASR